MYKKIFKSTKSYILCLVFMTISVVGTIMASVLLTSVLNAIIAKSLKETLFYLILNGFAWVVVLGSTYIANIYQARTIKTINTHIKNKVAKKLSNLSEEEFYSNPSETYLSNLTKDTDMVEDNLLNNHFNLIYNVELALLSFLAILYLNIFLAISSTIFFLIIYYTPKLFEKISRKNVEMLSKANAQYLDELRNQLGGFSVYSSYNLLKRFRFKLSSSFKGIEISKYKYTKTINVVGTILGFINMLSQFGNIAITAGLVVAGLVQAGVILSIGNLSSTFYNSLRTITDLRVSIRSAEPLLESLVQFDCDEETVAGKKCLNINSLVLKDISFNYRDKKVITDKTFLFKNKTKYLILGENGSGKTTLLKLLGIKLRPSTGSYYVNGEDLSDFDPSSVKAHIAYIEQEPYIFNDTILNNITLGKEFSKKDIEAVIKKCNLTSLIEERGFDYILNQSTNNLSGGQRQKIAIARALIRNCQVFLCDEITSNLDQNSRVSIYDTLLSDDNIMLVMIDHQIKESDYHLFDELIYL